MSPLLRNTLLVFAFGACAIGRSSGDVLYDNGAPNHPPPPLLPNGYEMTQWIEADDFTLTNASRLDAIQIHDLEIIGNFTGTILWRIYANTPSDKPGALLYSGTANATHQPTGYASGVYTEFLVTFPLAETVLPPGSYWLALHNGPLSNSANARVYWASTGQTGVRESQSDMGPLFAGNWFSNYVGGVPSELSFQASGAPLPQITLLSRSGSAPRISFTTANGYDYRVEYKNNLADADWLPLGGAELVHGQGSVMEVSDADPAAMTLPRRFYRVVLL